MEGFSRKDDGCPQLLDLIPRERDWVAKRSSGETNHGLERKLELSLGPPGGEDWTIKDNNKNKGSCTSIERDHESFYFSPKTLVMKSPWQQQQQQKQHQSMALPFLRLQPSCHPQGQVQLPATKKESSEPCGNSAEKKGFPSPATANTAVPNSTTSAQKRTAPGPVVGWPPIRSSRRNIASGNPSKLPSDSQNKDSPSELPENSTRSPFVKINMDGIPIGRKLDLKAYDSYEKLSHVVDELFKGLLAAQRETCDGGIDEDGGQKTIGGLLDGSGEYTLVYEDNEGDRMLVGDVPWHMFVSSVKRLRVLKSSELPKLSRGSSKQGSRLLC